MLGFPLQVAAKLRTAAVIGMTTTGSAAHRGLLEKVS